MRQVARRLRDGRLELVEVPEPKPPAGAVAVRLAASVVSAGTERATMEVARKGLIGKARARPDQAAQVLDRVRKDGLRTTWDLVKQRLDELGPLGYSAAGVVEEAGPGAVGVAPGERVAIAGGEFASHAELDIVPSLLCARIPEGVATEDAAFATIGAIAMNGFRLGAATIGGTVAVIGLGVVGQLAVRIARAAGCRVVATDLDEDLVQLAGRADVEAVSREHLGEAEAYAGSADAVLICAATSSGDPIRLAATLCRDRGTVVVVGDVAMDIPRAPFYEKELQLRLSRSYGPGRHDPAYELHGHDYPIGHARWTIQRNMGAFLDLVAAGKIAPSELVTHRFPFAQAAAAYEALDGDGPVVGVLLEYEGAEPVRVEPPARVAPRRGGGKPRFGLIGAGSFATGTLVPGLLAAGLEPAVVASAGGLSAESVRGRFDFEQASADPGEVIGRDDLDLLVVATRHDSHAELAAMALERGIATYVEKPLAIDWEGLGRVRAALERSTAPLFVGFNRRVAPLALAAREQLAGPAIAHFRVNAGPLPVGHWLNDPNIGGGRLLGEGCHFIDFLCFLARSDPRRVTASSLPSAPGSAIEAAESFGVTIEFEDGGIGSLSYSGVGPTGPGKERFEVSSAGAYVEVDDFAAGTAWRGRSSRSLGKGRQDKGFARQYETIADVLTGRAEAPAPDSFLVSTLATLATIESLRSGRPEPVLEAADGPR